MLARTLVVYVRQFIRGTLRRGTRTLFVSRVSLMFTHVGGLPSSLESFPHEFADDGVLLNQGVSQISISPGYETLTRELHRWGGAPGGGPTSWKTGRSFPGENSIWKARRSSRSPARTCD